EKRLTKTTGMERRDFVKSVAAGLAAGARGGSEIARAAPPLDKKIVGIQVGAVSFVDEGVEQVLDIFQHRAHINALWLAGFTFGRGLGGRQCGSHDSPKSGLFRSSPPQKFSLSD